MFYFVEACTHKNNQMMFHSKLSFNDKRGSGYIHVLLGRDKKHRYKFDTLIDLLTREEHADPQSQVRVQERQFIDANRNAEELQK